uniref:Uncharacterized protein n=1 Tax=Helianthus annuus TaxID=4232 RepID=A0A251VAM5_HELAN
MLTKSPLSPTTLSSNPSSSVKVCMHYLVLVNEDDGIFQDGLENVENEEDITK